MSFSDAGQVLNDDSGVLNEGDAGTGTSEPDSDPEPGDSTTPPVCSCKSGNQKGMPVLLALFFEMLPWRRRRSARKS
ncbi:MAG: hypothetical protein GY822_18445 [Deltaproteobacteria bacterium]|nr:hypothetical protein [Deltaproteobacteria bacterium]